MIDRVAEVTPRTVVAYVPDLMDRSKVSAAAPGVVHVRTPAALVAAVGDAAGGAGDEAGGAGVTVVVDLARPGVLEALPAVAATGARVLGFAGHGDRGRLAAARAAGCTEVLARSAFFSRVAELLA